MNGSCFIGHGALHDGGILAWSVQRKSWVFWRNATRFTSIKAARKTALEARLGVENTNFHIARH